MFHPYQHTVCLVGNLVVWNRATSLNNMARNILTRSLATITRGLQAVRYTPEGAVEISYPVLVSSPLSLQASIGE